MAKLAGVSTATVTRAIHNGEVVSPETRRRVMDAVATLGYRPNPIARELRHGERRGAVGLVVSSFKNVFQMGVAAGAERELLRSGVQLVIGSSDEDPSREPELARAMADRRVQVLMMMPDGPERDYLDREQLFGTPVVLVGRPPNGADVDVVVTADDTGIEEATLSLVDLGHRRIAVLGGDPGSYPTQQRLLGFRRALTARGLPADDDLIVTGLLSSEQAAAAAKRLLGANAPATAVIALNLGISHGVLLDRIRHGRRQAFIAFDESEITRGLDVSAVTRGPEEIGRQAARVALERIEAPQSPKQKLVLPANLARRHTGEIRPG
ncbi:MAG: LacI family transcriptional regulator [Actinomycetota bacterium]|nr:LacI family transcriptional regulator [Actinomycetota bacterium]